MDAINSLVIGAPTIKKRLKSFACDISIKKLCDLDHSVFRCDVIVIHWRDYLQQSLHVRSRWLLVNK